jgi:predicted DNA-binding protein
MTRRGPPKQFDARINLHLTSEMKERVIAVAAKRGEGVNEYLRAVVERAINADEVDQADHVA